jgi:cold shock CspA family protein
VPSTRLVIDHNDKGYGIIEDADGRQVYFAHEAVENRFGFDDLRKGQQLEYTLENAPYLRAASVRVAPNAVAATLRPAA